MKRTREDPLLSSDHKCVTLRPLADDSTEQHKVGILRQEGTKCDCDDAGSMASFEAGVGVDLDLDRARQPLWRRRPCDVL